MGSNEGRAWVSLGGVGHAELSEGFFGLRGGAWVPDISQKKYESKNMLS